MRLGLHLTDRCQLDCDHCLRDPSLAPRDLPLSTIEQVVGEAARHYGIRQVSFTGGEPTLHPELEQVLDVVAAAGCTWDMVTNGERFGRVLALLDASPPRLRSLRSVTFSLDGASAAAHDAIRGVGSFERVLSAISIAAARGLPFGVQMTLHARNEGELEQLGLLAAQLGAKHVSFAMCQPTGTRLDDELRLEPAAWRRLRDRVVSISRALAITVVLPEGWPTEEPLKLCDALRGDTLHVGVEGRLDLCCLHAGVPTGAGRCNTDGIDVAGGLLVAHRHLLGIQREVIEARMDRIAGEPSGAWSAFACNECLRDAGRPHWATAGVGGPPAARERWRGAWAREGARVRLAVVS